MTKQEEAKAIITQMFMDAWWYYLAEDDRSCCIYLDSAYSMLLQYLRPSIQGLKTQAIC